LIKIERKGSSKKGGVTRISVFILCMLVFASILAANPKIEFIQNFENTDNKEVGEFAREISSQIRDLRDLYILEVLYEYWENDAWIYEAKDIYTYDDDAYPIEILTLAWVDEDWQNTMRMVMTNNAEGYVVEMLWQMWEPSSEIWLDAALILYTYDVNWNMTEMLIQMWFGTEWMNSSRYTMTYNTDNNPTYVLIEEWDFVGGTGWLNDSQEFYSYDGLFLEEILEESWENESEWIWSIKYTYTEAGNSFPATKLRQNWNLQAWINDRYSQYTYDGDWNEIEDFEQNWQNDNWINFQTHYSTYEDGNIIERLTMDWEGGREWINGSRDTMTYGTLDAKDNTISLKNESILSNYPNPFSASTTISYFTAENTEDAEILIYNLKGQKIRTLDSINPAKATESLSHITWDGKDKNGFPVANGTYFYKLKSEKYIITKKMTLLR